MPISLLASVIFLGAGCAHIDYNLREVDEGRFYRSGQMTGGRLAEAIEEHDLAAVINLRGPSDDAWYSEEVEVCNAFGVEHVDISWSQRKLPTPESIETYLARIESGPYPMLIHCQGGTHRAGTGTAIYLMDRKGRKLDEVDEAFTIFFGDPEIGKLFELYEGSGKPFRQWAAEDYPALYREWPSR